MNRNRISIQTLDSPEFLNIKQMSNPLISKCEIKVLYVGANRNGSFISKEVATEMANTLGGCPIVGYYIESKEDFGDHGDQVVIDSEGVKFNKLTKPYGFVAPDAKVWFQKFEDKDDFGNGVVHEYLMTEGYLWTGQFEEVKRVLENGNPQSMELDEKTLKGYWSEDINRGVDFFIINDAIFSKLCILGDDVEPCFEGARVSAPSAYSTDSNFTKDLYTMMNELKFALQSEGGNTKMADLENFSNALDNSGEEVLNEKENSIDTSVETEFSNEEVVSEVESAAEDVEFACGDQKKKKEYSDKKEEEDSEKPEESKEEDSKEAPANDEEEEEKKKKFELLETEHVELQKQYSLLEEEVKTLRAFKLSVEDAKKDELINTFYMLSDEDKADVIANKSQYSLEDIEAKLSVICFRKKVSFETEQVDDSNATQPALMFNLDSHESDNLPAWLKVVADAQNKNN